MVSAGVDVPVCALGGYGDSVTSGSWRRGTTQAGHIKGTMFTTSGWSTRGSCVAWPAARRLARVPKRMLYNLQDAAKLRMSKKAKDGRIRRLDGLIGSLIGKSFGGGSLQTSKRIKKGGMPLTFMLACTSPDNNPAERPLRTPAACAR